MTPAEQLHLAIAGLPGVKEGRSRFGAPGAAWSVGGREFAHFHADDLVDLRLPRDLQATLRDDPKARFRAGRSEWLEFEFHTLEEAAQVAALARQAWDAARRR